MDPLKRRAEHAPPKTQPPRFAALRISSARPHRPANAHASTRVSGRSLAVHKAHTRKACREAERRACCRSPTEFSSKHAEDDGVASADGRFRLAGGASCATSVAHDP